MSKFLRCVLFLGLASVSHTLLAQGKKIEGSVIDRKTGLSIPNATIKNKNSNEVTVSDKNGRFNINANSGDQLEVLFLSYETRKIKISSETQRIEILMEGTSNSLAEVVVTGAFGIKRKSQEMGVANAALDGKEITNTQVVNPLNGMQAKVAGLQVNMFDSGVNPQVRVTLRGARNINDAKNEPLFVVDGVPLATVSYYNPQAGGSVRNASAISMLNPNDIENVTVLKGASAAAVYGSQGVNGVIIITTKNGKSGNGIINLSHTTTFDRVGWLPQLQDVYGSGFNGVYQPYEIRSWGPKYDGAMVKVGPILPDGTQWTIPFSPIKKQKQNFFNTGINNQENLSFSGGDDKSTYYLSGQYASTNGIIPKDKSTKSSVRLNGSRKFGKLNTSYSLDYVQTNTSTTTSEPWNNVRAIPLFIPLSELKDWKNTPQAQPEYYFSSTTMNPYWGIDNQRQDVKQENLTGNVSLDYQITPWFKAIYRLGLTSVNAGYKSFSNKFDSPDVPYRYYDSQGKVLTTARTTQTFGGPSSGSVNDQSINNQQINGDLLLQMDKNFGKISSHVLLGQNYQDIQYKFVQVGAAALNFPDIYNESNLIGTLNGGSQITHQRRYSYFGEVTIGYNDYLFATLNGRRESVSLLSEKNRSYFYPGANVSFIFSKAINAFRESSILSFGKLYASGSKTGNVTIDPYGLVNIYNNVPGFPFGNLAGAAINGQNLNENIHPEFVYSYEGGMQLGFFKDRLRLEATYAYADARDQILDIGTSFASGFGSAKANAARMKSKSLELTLNGDLVKSPDLDISLGFNYTHNNNTVVSLAGDQQTLNQFKGLYLAVGYAYPTYLLPDYRRDDQGRVIINKNTGQPSTANELSNFGTSQPVHMFGFNTAVRFRRLQFNMQVDARWGNKFYTAAAENETLGGMLPNSVSESYGRDQFLFPNSVIEVAPGQFEPNTTLLTKGDFTFWNNYKNILSNNLVDGRYIKLRELALGYDVPLSIVPGQQFIKNLKVSIFARNLVNLRAKDNIFGDPENIYINGIGFTGFRTLPSTRTFGFNVGVTL